MPSSNNSTAKNKDPFGFNRAINYDKLKDPKILEQLEEIFNEEEKDESGQKEE